MPPSSAKKRKAGNMWSGSSGSPSSSRRKGNNSSRRGGSSSSHHSSGINESKVEKMFDGLCDEDDSTVADLEGISKLCEQLSLDPYEDVRVLVLLYKLGANSKPSQITREEWIEGCHTLKLDSIAKFKAFLPQLDTGFMAREEFSDFFKFCFQFNRTGTHKTLDKDIVVMLLPMCLGGGRINANRLKTFIEFLEKTTDASYSKITLDQWRSFLDFSYEFEDDAALASYDEDGSAWPVLIDDYVEYMEGKRGK
mmetsp:Transcript_34742/g.77978  ORF Transcript_34742/g.77978 Transcript_34742/m.77978 type:complete len:252 (+) Transcript_34742:256-1011(+)